MHNIMEKIYLKKDIENIDKKIKMLGKTRWDAIGFINARVFTTILFTLFLIFFTHVSYLLLPLLVILYYMAFYHILITRRLRLREQKLDREALYYFEVLTLTLESGKNLQNSLELTCKNVHSELSSEFEDCLNEVKVGKSLIEALGDMQTRIPSENINNIIMNIMQTNYFGNSIIDTMNNQVDYLREKQILDIKGQINKIPNKISIVSVLFIVPLILLLVLGPYLINFIAR